MQIDRNTEHVQVVVIGGGQSGLSVGYCLQRAGLSFVILEAQDRGEARRATIVRPGLDADRAVDVRIAVGVATVLGDLFARFRSGLTTMLEYGVAGRSRVDQLGSAAKRVISGETARARERQEQSQQNARVHAITDQRNSPSSVQCRRATRVPPLRCDGESW